MSSYAAYKGVRGMAYAASDCAMDAKSKMKATSDIFEEGVVVSGKSFDDGELLDCANLLSQISSDMNAIANHCTRRMNEILQMEQNNNQNKILPANKTALKRDDPNFSFVEHSIK